MDCFFQAEDGIRDAQESRGLGDVYKRQVHTVACFAGSACLMEGIDHMDAQVVQYFPGLNNVCLLYTSDAADDLLCVDLGGRRIIKKKKTTATADHTPPVRQHPSTYI